MTSYRIDRVNKELLREMSEIVQRNLKNETAKEAIFTAVDCSRDLRHAKVYFITLDPERRKLVQAALKNSAGAMRGILGRNMRLRLIPELSFILDESEEKARAMDRLLDSIDTGQAGDSEGEAKEDDGFQGDV